MLVTAAFLRNPFIQTIPFTFPTTNFYILLPSKLQKTFRITTIDNFLWVYPPRTMGYQINSSGLWFVYNRLLEPFVVALCDND